jgi:transcriptional regulator with XRE-family HTH domain
MANELGEFLRARRGRLGPEDVGLPPGLGPRRTPGLRREELAAVAGVSIDYYIRLEQGKETNPSGPVLDALARALLLDAEERAHLYALANQVAGRVAGPVLGGSRQVRPGVVQLLETLRPYPAYVLSRTSDVLAANPEALALYAGLAAWPPLRRNTIRYTVLHPGARTLLGELLPASPEFARLWERHEVRHRRWERKEFRHPRVGELTLTTEILYLPEDGQRITIYQAPPGSRDHDALALLAMVAAEEAASS